MNYTLGELTTVNPESNPNITVAVFDLAQNGTIYWPKAANPYVPPVNASHTICTASNATIFSECCRDLNGTFVDQSGSRDATTPLNATATPQGQSYIPWCEVRGPEYNSEARGTPDAVRGFSECVNNKAGDDRPGLYVRNFTLEKVAWNCQGVGQYNDIIANWVEPNVHGAVPEGAAIQVAPSIALLSVTFALCQWRNGRC